MKYALCHYSLHRTCSAENLDCLGVARTAQELGFEAIDFHARLLGDFEQAKDDIPAALAETGLTLSGLSLGNNFALDDQQALQEQIDTVLAGIDLAAAVDAPVSRIFGGHLHKEDRAHPDLLQKNFERIIDALSIVVQAAEQAGVVLALENHGGLPASAAEQISVLETINSPNLKATIDVGNYMQVEEHGHESLRKVVDYAAYIHFKDFHWGPPLKACTLGDGDVDLAACLSILEDAQYQGYIAIEYEGHEEERLGIRRSMEYLGGLRSPA